MTAGEGEHRSVSAATKRFDLGTVLSVTTGRLLRGGRMTDRILWNERDGCIDEVVVSDVSVHVEQMNDRCWWIGIYKGDGPDAPYWMGNFHANSRGVMQFTEQENAGIVWDDDREHLRLRALEGDQDA